MIAVFGAAGRTGRAVVREARRRGLAARPIVRDDRDGNGLASVCDPLEVSYADADRPTSLPSALSGCAGVVSCIDPRAAGPSAPPYGAPAAMEIALAAAAARIPFLHLSVIGAFRWSRSPANRAAASLERMLRQPRGRDSGACPGAWAVLRVSAWHDEVIDAHVRPPDGGSPAAIPAGSRWSPMSREDGARLALDCLGRLPPARLVAVGGPALYDSHALDEAVAAFRTGAAGRPTNSAPLPEGDLAVPPETTRCAAGWVPAERLEEFLARPEPAAAARSGGRHPADMGDGAAALSAMGPALRRVVHAQLVSDLARFGIPADGVRLDFSAAHAGGRTAAAHDGSMTDLADVRALGADGTVLHRGPVSFLRDELAEELRVWWGGPRIPPEVWERLDMGVRRRATD